MKECIICSNRRVYLRKLKRKFRKDLQIRNVECIDDIGMEFLYLKKPSTCSKCNGRGWEEEPTELCPECNGTGRMLSKETYIDELKECPKCKSIVATASKDFEQTKHYHRCSKCGWTSRVYEDIKGVTW